MLEYVENLQQQLLAEVVAGRNAVLSKPKRLKGGLHKCIKDYIQVPWKD